MKKKPSPSERSLAQELLLRLAPVLLAPLADRIWKEILRWLS